MSIAVSALFLLPVFILEKSPAKIIETVGIRQIFDFELFRIESDLAVHELGDLRSWGAGIRLAFYGRGGVFGAGERYEIFRRGVAQRLAISRKIVHAKRHVAARFDRRVVIEAYLREVEKYAGADYGLPV